VPRVRLPEPGAHFPVSAETLSDIFLS
jgi:hypothetical protein